MVALDGGPTLDVDSGPVDAGPIADATTDASMAGDDAEDAVDAATDDATPDAGPDGDATFEDATPDAGPEVDSGPDDPPWIPDDGRVYIRRDPWGVPHVLAGDARGAGYGVGWAQAEDQLPRPLRNLWAAQGRLAEVDGSDVLNVDRTARLLRLVADVEAAWDGYPPLVHEVTGGFAAGVNAFMVSHPEAVPAWAEPIQAAWLPAFATFFLIDGQIGAANGDRAGLAPPLASLAFDGVHEFSNAKLPSEIAAGAGADTPAGDTGMGFAGSNGWAVTGERAAGGAGFHLGDPHMPFYGPWTLWEMHVRCPEVEIAGATFPGLPVPVFGRNAHVAWTTCSTPTTGASRSARPRSTGTPSWTAARRRRCGRTRPSPGPSCRACATRRLALLVCK